MAAELDAAGLVTRLHRSKAWTDLMATLRPPGMREIEVLVDEDGYTEIRYWASLDDMPADAVAVIAGALAAITAPRSLAATAGHAAGAVAGYDGAVTERVGGSDMPGHEDRVAEQERRADQTLPRTWDDPHESRVHPADLQARLERLPLNHPSSPFRDDGSRKPPPPDLTEYELPLPGDTASSADPDLAPEDHGHTGSDCSPDGNGGQVGEP